MSTTMPPELRKVKTRASLEAAVASVVKDPLWEDPVPGAPVAQAGLEQVEQSPLTQVEGLKAEISAKRGLKRVPSEAAMADREAVLNRMERLLTVAERSDALVGAFLVRCIARNRLTAERVDQMHWVLTRLSNAVEGMAAPRLRFSPNACVRIFLDGEKAVAIWESDGQPAGEALELAALTRRLAMTREGFLSDEADRIAVELWPALEASALGLPGFFHERGLDGRSLVLRLRGKHTLESLPPSQRELQELAEAEVLEPALTA